MSDIENGKTNGAAKDEKLGIVPISKLGAVVPAKSGTHIRKICKRSRTRRQRKHFNDCSLNTRAAEAKIKGKVNAGAYHRAEIHRLRPRFTAV